MKAPKFESHMTPEKYAQAQAPKAVPPPAEDTHQADVPATPPKRTRRTKKA